MSVAAEQFDRSKAPNTWRNAASTSVASDWQAQLSASGPVEYIQWCLADEESMELVLESAGVDAIFRSRSSELAEIAIRTGLRQSCILASPTPVILIAEPIPAKERACLCARFACKQSELSEAALTDRHDIVARAAAALSSHPLPAVAPVALPESLPSWNELAHLAKRKLLALTVQGRSSLQFYVGIVAVCAGLCAIPWPYKIHCDVVCEPVLRRYVAAPFDARLLQSNVVVGQQVEQGAVLATLDGGELRSQLASVLAKRAQAEQRQLAALSLGDHSKSEFERLEVEHLRREAELLERRQAKLDIRSPIDGVVITGDLERAAGAPLSVGDNLFEIASLEQLVAEIAIPESDITFVKDNMPVTLVFDAIPGSRIESTVQRIHLRNEIRDNASVFVAEAELGNEGHLLRPGMNAKATINAGYRTVGWQLFHRPYDAMRQWIGW